MSSEPRGFALLTTLRWLVLLLLTVGTTLSLTLVPIRVGKPLTVAALFDCNTPCFMGIIPGVTTDDDAQHLLEAQSITSIERRNNPFSPHIAQLLFDLDASHALRASGLDSGTMLYLKDTGVVWSIQLSTDMPLTDLQTVFGEGNLLQQHYYSSGEGFHLLRTSWIADEVETHIYTRLDCPIHLQAIGQTQAYRLDFLDTAYSIVTPYIDPRVYRGC